MNLTVGVSLNRIFIRFKSYPNKSIRKNTHELKLASYVNETAMRMQSKCFVKYYKNLLIDSTFGFQPTYLKQNLEMPSVKKRKLHKDCLPSPLYNHGKVEKGITLVIDNRKRN